MLFDRTELVRGVSPPRRPEGDISGELYIAWADQHVLEEFVVTKLVQVAVVAQLVEEPSDLVLVAIQGKN